MAPMKESTRDIMTALYEKLATYGIDDSLRANAYESLTPQQKGKLKESLARLYAFWNHGPLHEKRVRQYPGFCVHEETAPASLAIVCCRVGDIRGEEFIPAVLPALMAGVSHFIPWFVRDGETALPDDLLMALELLGIDDAFSSSSRELAKVLQYDMPLSCKDRLVIMGNCFEDGAGQAGLPGQRGNDSSANGNEKAPDKSFGKSFGKSSGKVSGKSSGKSSENVGNGAYQTLQDNPFSFSALCSFLLMEQGVQVQYFPHGQDIYPSLTPQWYCNNSIVFQS